MYKRQARIGRFFTSPAIVERLALLEAKQNALAPALLPATGAAALAAIQRTPYFCSCLLYTSRCV